MKKIFVLFFISAGIIAGCKKDKEPQVTVQVKDAVTNTPVNGITVGLHRCMPGEPLCGLIAYRTSQTGADGTCSFRKDDFDQTKQTEASGPGYWRLMGLKSVLMSIYPEGWMRLRIIRGTSYPAQSQLLITANYMPGSFFSSASCSIAADSTFLLRCIGGVTHKVDWRVVDPANNQLNTGTWDQLIPRQDIVNVTLNY